MQRLARCASSDLTSLVSCFSRWPHRPPWAHPAPTLLAPLPQERTIEPDPTKMAGHRMYLAMHLPAMMSDYTAMLYG